MRVLLSLRVAHGAWSHRRLTWEIQLPRRFRMQGVRKHGVDKTARRMVEFLEQRGIEGASVLDVGGGVGEIQIELLKRGAARAINFELSPAYDEEARKIIREAGLEDKAERRL